MGLIHSQAYQGGAEKEEPSKKDQRREFKPFVPFQWRGREADILPRTAPLNLEGQRMKPPIWLSSSAPPAKPFLTGIGSGS